MNIFHWIQQRLSQTYYNELRPHSRFSLLHSRLFSGFRRQPAYVRKQQQVDPNAQTRGRRGRRRK